MSLSEKTMFSSCRSLDATGDCSYDSTSSPASDCAAQYPCLDESQLLHRSGPRVLIGAAHLRTPVLRGNPEVSGLDEFNTQPSVLLVGVDIPRYR